jgi:hypothetical protein
VYPFSPIGIPERTPDLKLPFFNHLDIHNMDTLLPPPKLTHLFTLRCAVDPPMEVGNGPYGRRRCVPIKSGSVKGKHINGEVVPTGGADFMYKSNAPDTTDMF